MAPYRGRSAPCCYPWQLWGAVGLTCPPSDRSTRIMPWATMHSFPHDLSGRRVAPQTDRFSCEPSPRQGTQPHRMLRRAASMMYAVSIRRPSNRNGLLIVLRQIPNRDRGGVGLTCPEADGDTRESADRTTVSPLPRSFATGSGVVKWIRRKTRACRVGGRHTLSAITPVCAEYRPEASLPALRPAARGSLVARDGLGLDCIPRRSLLTSPRQVKSIAHWLPPGQVNQDPCKPKDREEESTDERLPDRSTTAKLFMQPSSIR